MPIQSLSLRKLVLRQGLAHMSIRKRLDVHKVLRKYNYRYLSAKECLPVMPSEFMKNRFSIHKKREKQRELANRILELDKKAYRIHGLQTKTTAD